MKWLKIILFFLATGTYVAKAQTNYDESLKEYFNLFEGHKFSTDYLWNRTFMDTEIFENSKLKSADWSNSYVITNPINWQILYNRLQQAYIGEGPSLANMSSFWDTENINYRSNNTIPVGIINIEGNYLDPASMSSYYDVETKKLASDAPFETVQIFAASHLQSTVYTTTLNFVLDVSTYFSNIPQEVQGIAIDFDNGNGEVMYDLNSSIIPVNYSSIGEKNIRYRLITQSGSLLSFSKLNIALPSNVSKESMRTSATGVRTQTVLGCDNVLDKPIIVVEGFDPLQERRPQDLVDKYTNLPFWNELSGSGYDLVAVTFLRNHDPLNDNATDLISLITDVNADKQGDFENIIIGESMGGLISRVALRRMENSNIDHQTGLYISFDSPHKGANVPLGIQQLGNNALNLTSYTELTQLLVNIIPLIGGDGNLNEAGDAIEAIEANDSPAARQMLVKHWRAPHGSNPDFENFQSYLNSLGFPQTSRNIALINGSNERDIQSADDANGQVDIGEQFVDRRIGNDCTPLRFDVNVWVSPINTTAQVSEIDIDSRWPLFCSKLDDVLNISSTGSFNQIPWDLAPGGIEFGDEESDREEFCFVPTVSGMALNDNLINGTDGAFYYDEDGATTRRKAHIIANNQTLFDDIYSDSFNSAHVGVATKDDELLIIAEQEIMNEAMYLQNRVVKSNWNRDYEANDIIVTGNDVNPTAWTNRSVFISEDNKIIDNGDFIVESGADVSLKAVNSITLGVGTTINAGATFVATTANSSGSCNQPAKLANNLPFVARPEIGIKKHGETTSFSIQNFPKEGKHVSCEWLLRGAGDEWRFNGPDFDIIDLKDGQYSIHATLSGANTQSKSKVFVIANKNNTNHNITGNSYTTEFKDSQNSIYPNPSNGNLNIKYHMQTDSQIKVSVTDISGKVATILTNKYQSAGEHAEYYDISYLDSGSYLIHIETQHSKTVKKLIVN